MRITLGSLNVAKIAVYVVMMAIGNDIAEIFGCGLQHAQ